MQISRNVPANDAPAVASNAELSAASMAAKLANAGTAQASIVQTSGVNAGDTAAISSAAALALRANTAASPETAQIRQITSALADGSYRVDSGVLASSVMETMLQPGLQYSAG